jgi:hypothetical protein
VKEYRRKRKDKLKIAIRRVKNSQIRGEAKQKAEMEREELIFRLDERGKTI